MQFGLNKETFRRIKGTRIGDLSFDHKYFFPLALITIISLGTMLGLILHENMLSIGVTAIFFVSAYQSVRCLYED